MNDVSAAPSQTRSAGSGAVSTDPADYPRGFASDNAAGVHPKVLAAIVAANIGHTASYGGDPWSARFAEVARGHFGAEAEAVPVLNGTGANVLALQAALPRWGAVICARTAHINVDEGGAPEQVGGVKLVSVDTPDGKLTPALVDREAWGFGDEHRAQPLAVSISQVTELGTCYTPEEVRALADHAHERGMLLHVDGSRLGQAAAHLGVSLAALTTEAGADVLSLGGTKTGLLGAEAVVVLRAECAPGIRFLRKASLQLASKMRFVSAQLLALYEGDLWLQLAEHTNAMATRLAGGIEALEAEGRPGIRLAHPVQSNAVFVHLPPARVAGLQRRFGFSAWPSGEHLFRLVCAFDTAPEDVDAFLAALRD